MTHSKTYADFQRLLRSATRTACFKAYTGGGGGGGGGGGLDIKVKVSAADTTTDYLSSKIGSQDGTVTFTILNPAGNEYYDVSIAPIQVTVAAAQALIGTSTLLPGRMYQITDAYHGTAVVWVFACANNMLETEGFTLFTNAVTVTPVPCFVTYDVATDFISRLYFAERNIEQIVNPSLGLGYSIDTLNLNSTTLLNLYVENTLWTDDAAGAVNFNCDNSTFINSTVLFFDNTSISICNLNDSTLDCTSTTDNSFTLCDIFQNSIVFAGGFSTMSGVNMTLNSTVNITASTLATTTMKAASASLSDNSTFTGQLDNGAVLVLASENTFANCKVGFAKTVVPPAGYSATNAGIEGVESTYEAAINPDAGNILDFTGYEFVGVVRPNTGANDLKEFANFPTDHIFLLVPANAVSLNVFDAGAGGVNIYLNTAATNTLDGTKDDTLAFRSGLNDSSRVFQIGGWQAPSA